MVIFESPCGQGSRSVVDNVSRNAVANLRSYFFFDGGSTGKDQGYPEYYSLEGVEANGSTVNCVLGHLTRFRAIGMRGPILKILQLFCPSLSIP
jgi:hypothetical protein